MEKEWSELTFHEKMYFPWYICHFEDCGSSTEITKDKVYTEDEIIQHASLHGIDVRDPDIRYFKTLIAYRSDDEVESYSGM